MNRVIQAWRDNGLPPDVPFFMTEGNDLGEGGAGTVKSALLLADISAPPCWRANRARRARAVDAGTPQW